MMDKLVGEAITPEHEALYGKWGSLPPNMKEIGIEGLAQSHFFIYSPRLIEYRQTRLSEEERKQWNFKHDPILWLYYFHHREGYVLVQDYWGKTVRVFFFTACVHDWRRPTEEEHQKGVPRPANCYHVSICDKCNEVEAVDSSG
jgi:hypothetical protein